MSWFRFHNYSAMPVHLAISTAGIIQWSQNDVPPQTPYQNGYAEVDMQDAIWHDLTVIPSNGKNQINQTDVNIWKGIEIGIGSIGIVAAGAAIPFTGGASAAIVLAVIGGVISVGTAVVSIADYAVHPATISNLYAPDGYNFDIRGLQVQGKMDDQRFIVSGYSPLSVSWHNNTSGAHDTVTA